MKLVAAARLRRAQERVLQARPYSDKMREMLGYLGEAGEMPEHPLLERRPVKSYGVLLLTAERGLCGSFNTNLIRHTQELLRDSAGEAILITVGAKGHKFFSKRGYPVEKSFTIPTSGPTSEHARAVMDLVREMFESGRVDAIRLVYSRFYSAIRQMPQTVQLLPIEPPEHEPGKEAAFSKAYTFEPGPTALLAELLPRYAFTLIMHALYESSASEHGSRMTAMTNATDSAGEMIDTLTLEANRRRQAAITKEILEVVGGAEALKD